MIYNVVNSTTTSLHLHPLAHALNVIFTNTHSTHDNLPPAATVRRQHSLHVHEIIEVK